MPHGKRRFSVTQKVALGLAIIIVVGIASMWIIYRGLERVGTALEQVASIQAPIVAAAYGMEVNVNGAMLHVLNYLNSRRREHRVEAEDDIGDFARYHATYLELNATDRERELARRVSEQFLQFAGVAAELMKLADRQERLYAAISEDAEEIDYILDTRLQPALFHEANLRRVGIGAAVASTDLGAETAEVEAWVASYHRGPTQATRKTIQEKLAIMDRTLNHFLSFDPGPDPLVATALRRLAARVAAQVKEVIALEDEILAGRNRLIGLRESMDDLLDDEIQVLAIEGLDQPRAQARAATEDVLDVMRLLGPLFLMAAGIIGFLLIHMIRAQLGKLYRGTLAVTGGDLSYRIPPASNDEFGDLARQYNMMVEQLHATTVSRDRLMQEMAERERAEQEREKLQAELRRSETMSAMGALVAGVAHEVRNPLFAISSTLDALSARFGNREEYRRFTENLQAQVGRLGRLMQDLLAYGRPATEKLTEGSVNDVVAPSIESCLSLARETGATIETRLDPDVPPVRMNPGRLGQALHNLIDNALRHAPSGTAVTVETHRFEDRGREWVEYAVSDRGPGFQAEDLPNVFEPFFTRRRGGIGLGLALVQRIANEHGGEASARNREQGGAVVTLRLPAAQA